MHACVCLHMSAFLECVMYRCVDSVVTLAVIIVINDSLIGWAFIRTMITTRKPPQFPFRGYTPCSFDKPKVLIGIPQNCIAYMHTFIHSYTHVTFFKVTHVSKL